MSALVSLALLRVAFPAAAVGAAVWAEARGLGLFRQLGTPLWLAGPIGFVLLDFAVWLEHVASHKWPALFGACIACTMPTPASTSPPAFAFIRRGGRLGAWWRFETAKASVTVDIDAGWAHGRPAVWLATPPQHGEAAPINIEASARHSG